MLFLSYNQFSGSLPPLDAGFTRLQEISFSHNRLTGSLPDLDPSSVAEVLDSVRVSRLDISYNFITGTINPAISFLPTLKSVDVSGNLFANEFPARFGWASIRELAAADNAFTGTISTIWKQDLTRLEFSGNHMTGGIPSELCEFTNLEFLLLGRNSLSGTIPSCMGNLNRLRALELGSANLQGQIPPSLERCRQLTVLDLQNNTVTGQLPTSIGTLTLMNQLRLNDNFLSGSLPSELGELTFLRELHLEHNAFVGTVPDELSRLSSLESLSLAGNAIVGSVPDAVCQMHSLDLTFENVGCDVSCECCQGDESLVCG